jgi:hypothetical protein
MNRFALSVIFVFYLFTAAFAGGDNFVWRPISQQEMAMTKPVVDADADAEAIFWDVELDNKKGTKLFYTHYVRVKIFTERGREKFSKFDIPFVKGKKVEDVAARVIKPDGTIVELSPSDIFERDIIQFGKVKVRAKSFAVPGIEPGVIVEYHYKETFKNDSADGERLYFQRDIPMQSASYSVRPYKEMTLNFDFHNMPRTEFRPNDDGFYVATLKNVPAFKPEPQMPPDEETRSWVYLSYRTIGGSFAWGMFGSKMGIAFGQITEPTDEVRRKASALTSHISDDEEKLRKIYEFAQKQIRNVSFDSTVTDEQRENLKIKGADDVLKRALGSYIDIDYIFASLAKAAGFEVNLVFSGDRSENFFNPERDVSGSYIHPSGIAVKTDSGWKFYNPGIPYMPFGKTFWFEEGVSAILVGERGYIWGKTPSSTYSQSQAQRTAKLKLLEDGTLEGTVKIEYDGHQAIIRRRDQFKDSPDKRAENFKDEIKERMSTAEISALTVENFDDAEKPLTYNFKIRVPNYAQKTGKRLFFQLGFFEYGSKPLFSSSTRTHQIYFDYAWSEEDNIEFELPKNFLPENPETPKDVIEKQNVGGLKVFMLIRNADNTIKYQRKFFFGGGSGGNLLFPVTAYAPLKTLFDSFNKADSQSITLRQSD